MDLLPLTLVWTPWFKEFKRSRYLSPWQFTRVRTFLKVQILWILTLSAQTQSHDDKESSDHGDKESSVADPGTSEDLAAVLDAAADTPTLTKRNSTTGKARRDSFYVRQLGSDENQVTIKYQPESLKRIKYRDVLKHLDALLEYEHKYRIKLPLARTVSQDCIDQILSHFNLSDEQFHDSSLSKLLVYLSIMCTPSTRQ